MSNTPGFLRKKTRYIHSCPYPGCNRVFSRAGAVTYHLRYTTQHPQLNPESTQLEQVYPVNDTTSRTSSSFPIQVYEDAESDPELPLPETDLDDVLSPPYVLSEAFKSTLLSLVTFLTFA